MISLYIVITPIVVVSICGVLNHIIKSVRDIAVISILRKSGVKHVTVTKDSIKF